MISPPSLPIAIGTSPTGEGAKILSPLGEIRKGVKMNKEIIISVTKILKCYKLSGPT